MRPVMYENCNAVFDFEPPDVVALPKYCSDQIVYKKEVYFYAAIKKWDYLNI